MDRRQPFGNQLTGLNLLQLPVAGNDKGNTRQFLENLGRLRMPQVQGTQNMSRELYRQDSREVRNRQFSDNYYDREQMISSDHRQRPLREAAESRNFDRGDYRHEDRGRIHGLMEKEVSFRSLFPEVESSRYSERHGREEFARGSYLASKNNPQSEIFRSHTENLGDNSFENDKGLKLSVMESKYGRRDNTAIPWYAQVRPNCYLVPPSDDTDVLPLGVRQPGCRSISVGGLPLLADELIVREVFNVCGPIEKITFKSAQNNIKARKWQVRFSRHDSVEKAVKFNGHILVIGDGSDRKNKIGCLHVSYDQETNDDGNLKTNTMMNRQRPGQKEEDRNLNLTYYNRQNVFQILDLVRRDTSVVQALETMAHWFEKGECNRTTVNVFHSMLNTTHSFVKRLISKRKEHEEQVEKQKKQAMEQANEIKQQYDAVWKVFEAATKKKSWDIFTKAQRKTISQWHALIKNEIRSAQEAEIQNREEVGMDLDDEVPNLGGLIEQPALQMTEEEQQPEQDETLSPSKAKKPRCDAQASESDADSTDALKLENEKLRTQVESLKGIAEQNTNLMWSMQSYQYQADLARQQYSERLKEKNHEITRLQQAVQYIKQNIKDTELLTDLETLTSDQPSELQIVVELSNGYQKTTGEVAVKHDEGMENYAGEIQEEVMDDDDGRKVEQITENHNEIGKEESGEQFGGKEADSEDLSEKGQSSLLSQTEHQVRVDLQSEGVPIQIENTELTEKAAEVSIALEAAVKEDEKSTEDVEKPTEVKWTPVEEDKPSEDGVKSVEGGNKPVEGEKLEEEDAVEDAKPEEDNAVEEEIHADEEEDDEEEGCGRFVQIDDEQFEVIDDMDEESDDDYKEVVTRSPSNDNVEQMNEQLTGKGDYKEATDPKPLNENDEQVSEQSPDKDYHKETVTCSPSDENVEQAHEQLTGKDDYKEVTDHELLKEHDGQVSEQPPADWSVYQQDYNAQYQNWLLGGMAGYGPLELGPTLVRLSGEELVLVGIICSYLQLCPSGATSGEIRDHLSRQFKERRKDVVERLLSSLPVLFRTGESSGNTKWKFCGFDMFQSKSER